MLTILTKIKMVLSDDSVKNGSQCNLSCFYILCLASSHPVWSRT
uniref:Uncharacterized protein n=1 Tax=Rhizophora mucronata TaxID=61149 RepID=A0A2P2QIQ1_RHIMU